MKRFLMTTIIFMSAMASQCFSQQNIVETAASAGQFNTLITAASAAGLADTLATGNFTVFAPTDEAFAKLDPAFIQDLLRPENKSKLAAVLSYHVVPGSVNARDAYSLRNAKTVNGQRLPLGLDETTPTVDGARLLKADIQCSNGVIHVIDSVLMPATETIPVVASNTGTFQTLLAAVTEAGLAETLGSSGPFTVFAPTDAAFEKLPLGTVEELLQPANRDKLVSILKYHVVSGRVYDDEALKAGQATTLLGQSLRVSFSESGLMINDATIVVKNIAATNGVIHVVDSVLLPSAQMVPAAAVTMLDNAVSTGVPLFNSGHHQTCCDTYMGVLQQLSQAGVSGAPDQFMTMIDSTITQAEQQNHATTRAWTLRHGIDNAVTQLRQMPMMMTSP